MKRTLFSLVVLSLLFTTACQNKEKLFKEHYQKGLIALDASNLDLALKHFDECIALKPNHPESHFYRGAVLFSKRDYESAIESYTKAIDLNPNYADAYHNRGLTYNVLNRLDEKCEDFFRAYELGKTNLEIRLKECQ
ncbi:MAG: tetratricopeptide repeat protein [Bacteroidales bacterium]|nr:tetratricopeptide repeat protein [Bacteroidales bacterium]MDY0217274.1 tetratricopeptide repeat protein [Bacteroidales bacterium]